MDFLPEAHRKWGRPPGAHPCWLRVRKASCEEFGELPAEVTARGCTGTGVHEPLVAPQRNKGEAGNSRGTPQVRL